MMDFLQLVPDLLCFLCTYSHQLYLLTLSVYLFAILLFDSYQLVCIIIYIHITSKTLNELLFMVKACYKV